jgi:hypothetical protein
VPFQVDALRALGKHWRELRDGVGDPVDVARARAFFAAMDELRAS